MMSQLRYFINPVLMSQVSCYQKMPSKPSEVERVTQAKYSRFSGPDSIYHVTEYKSFGKPFKVRMRRGGFYDYNAAASVVVLTDKPQKPLPLDWDSLMPAEEPEPEAAASVPTSMLAAAVVAAATIQTQLF